MPFLCSFDVFKSETDIDAASNTETGGVLMMMMRTLVRMVMMMMMCMISMKLVVRLVVADTLVF